MDRQKAICNILAVKGLFFDYASVTPFFKRNIPVNITETVQLVQALTGVVSTETLLAQLPFIEDVQIEMEKLEEEAMKDDIYKDAFMEMGVPDEEGQALPLEDELDEETALQEPVKKFNKNRT